MDRLSENSVVDIKNKSWAVTAELEVPADGVEGVIIVQGGRFGGWSVYAKGGRATFYYNVLGITSYRVDAAQPIPTGTAQVRMEFAYDGGGRGKGGTATLCYDGKEVGTGRIDQTQGVVFSADETTDVGRETGTTVSPTTPPTPADSTARSTGANRPWRGRQGRRSLHRPRRTPPGGDGPPVTRALRTRG
jgi:hypothetical protein